jgi:hypothetical protein
MKRYIVSSTPIQLILRVFQTFYKDAAAFLLGLGKTSRIKVSV